MSEIVKYVKRHFLIDVKLDDNLKIVTLYNIEVSNILQDLVYIWSIKNITKFIFSKIERNSLSFDYFFIPDMVYSLSKILEDKKRKTNKYELLNIIKILKTRTWYSNYFLEHPSRLDYDKLKELKYTLLPVQLNAVKAYDLKTQALNLKGLLLAAAVGSGKAQPLYSKIKVPNGWTTMGNIQLNDIVITKDGSHAKVIGLHPQGELDIYRITFSDGRFTNCSLEHLWKVYTCYKNNGSKVITTTELIKLMSENNINGKKYYIDLPDSENSINLDLPIDPYLLGVILPSIKIQDDLISFNIYNKFIINEIRELLPNDFSLNKVEFSKTKFTLNNFLINLDKEFNVISTKQIPDKYLNGSTTQRLSLLQGLMDVSGDIDKEGNITYRSNIMGLAKSVQYLVRSLGGLANITSEVNETKTVSYITNIKLKNYYDIFRLAEKKYKTINQNNYNEKLKLQIDSIEYIGKEPAQCISIDHPDQLYVTDDFIVTHNSVMALAIANCLNPTAVIVICPKSLITDVWVDAINVQFNGKKRIWQADLNVPITDKFDYYIFNYEALGKADVFFGRNEFRKIVIVADESHNMNNIDSLRTRQFLLLCKLTKSNDIIFSTGTAISGEAKELRTIFRAIDPLFTPSAENKFNVIFTKSANKTLEIVKHRLGMESAGITIEEVMKGTKPIIKDIKVKLPNSKIYTLDYIKKEFNQYMIDKSKEYQRDMPKYEKIYGTGIAIYKSTISSSKEAYDLSIYIQYIKEIRAGFNAKNMGFMSSYCNTFENKTIIPKLPMELKKGFKEAASIVKYYKLYILGKWLGEGLGRRKIQLHKEMILYSGIDKIVNDSIKKTICFTSYVDVLLAANKYFVDRGYKPLLIYSDTSKEVGNILKTFKTSDEQNPLVASIAMLNAGATLTIANTVIFLNLPPRSKEYQQAYARAFRLGQDTQVYVYNLILDTGGVPNISTRMADTVTWSKLQAQKITGVQTKLSRIIDEETFMDNLLTHYTPEEDHVSLFNKIVNLFTFN